MIRTNKVNNNKYSNKIVINCKNRWVLFIDDANTKINNDIYNKLKDFDEIIYWSDDSFDYWVSDFEIDGVWFEVERLKNINDKELFISTYKI